MNPQSRWRSLSADFIDGLSNCGCRILVLAEIDEHVHRLESVVVLHNHTIAFNNVTFYLKRLQQETNTRLGRAEAAPGGGLG